MNMVKIDSLLLLLLLIQAVVITKKQGDVYRLLQTGFRDILIS